MMTDVHQGVRIFFEGGIVIAEILIGKDLKGKKLWERVFVREASSDAVKKILLGER